MQVSYLHVKVAPSEGSNNLFFNVLFLNLEWMFFFRNTVGYESESL